MTTDEEIILTDDELDKLEDDELDKAIDRRDDFLLKHGLITQLSDSYGLVVDANKAAIAIQKAMQKARADERKKMLKEYPAECFGNPHTLITKAKREVFYEMLKESYHTEGMRGEWVTFRMKRIKFNKIKKEVDAK